jgi:hypothetical protein
MVRKRKNSKNKPLMVASSIFNVVKHKRIAAMMKFYPKFLINPETLWLIGPVAFPVFYRLDAVFIGFLSSRSQLQHLETRKEMHPIGLHLIWPFLKTPPLLCTRCPQGVQYYLGSSHRTSNTHEALAKRGPTTCR